MFRKIAPIAAAAAFIAVPAFAHAADAPKDKGGYKECFWARDADSFAAPDEHNLYVRVHARDVYHFEMFGPCLDIDWNQRIALISRGSDWICNGMDAEVVTHSPIGRQRCLVKNVRKLSPAEIAALPKRAKP